MDYGAHVTEVHVLGSGTDFVGRGEGTAGGWRVIEFAKYEEGARITMHLSSRRSQNTHNFTHNCTWSQQL